MKEGSRIIEILKISKQLIKLFNNLIIFIIFNYFLEFTVIIIVALNS